MLVDRYLPSPMSGAKIMSDLATEMARRGHDVTVVTGDSGLQHRIEITKESGVTVIRVRSKKMRHRSKIVRTINEIRLSRIIWTAARDLFEAQPCDLVVYWCPTIFWSGLVSKLKAINGCGSYLVMRDMFPQWALDTGVLSRYGLPYWFFRLQELRLYGTADVIGVQSPVHLNYFAGPALRGRYNVEVLFNWTNLADRPNASHPLRSKLDLGDKIIFVYGGNLGVAQDLDNVLRLAARMAEEKNVHFLLLGDGSESNRIKLEIQRGRLTNVFLHPAVSPDEYMDILAECDVGLITLRRDLTVPNFPGKMLGYMALRMPMLASINTGNDLSTIVLGHNAGFVCNNGEDEVFYQYALQLARDRDLRQRMGQNAYRLLVDKFDVSNAANQILSHFLH